MEQLRAVGVVIIGKIDLHVQAVGMTGEGPRRWRRVPADREASTGGSSSGSAVGIPEGSAVASIGADTDGSIRVSAAL